MILSHRTLSAKARSNRDTQRRDKARARGHTFCSVPIASTVKPLNPKLLVLSATRFHPDLCMAVLVGYWPSVNAARLAGMIFNSAALIGPNDSLFSPHNG